MASSVQRTARISDFPGFEIGSFDLISHRMLSSVFMSPGNGIDLSRGDEAKGYAQHTKSGEFRL